MLVRIIECHSTEIPSLPEIKECIELARQNNATVRLRWFVKGSGYYDTLITSANSAEKLNETIEPYRNVTKSLKERFDLQLK